MGDQECGIVPKLIYIYRTDLPFDVGACSVVSQKHIFLRIHNVFYLGQEGF